MGLSAPKKRAKLSHDPNNTAWARNTESFGHKILASQGWTPGETLGATGAAHADHYTAGSNSHIRVLLKDDQLGLGAKRGNNNAETFGLSLFSGILGRLNGKSEVQVEKEQKAQRDVELALYASRKKGYINFVSAGFLVGDRIDKAEMMKKEELNKLKNAKVAKKTEVVAESKPTEHESQGTKRKRAEAASADKESSDSASSSSEEEEKAVVKSKKSKKSTKKESSADESEAVKAKKNRRTKKDKKHTSSSTSTSTSDDEERAAKKARKAERAERRAQKEERRKKKDAKKAAKSTSVVPVEPVSDSLAPQAAPFVGRHAVRQRYIAAKGRAHLDPQALKEIFMVKA
ncbi:hypothetical protein BDV97DRAFT_366086 [Delphinella strobiligena]|nr:hypothetical protein BDV97DRAFT_366086 [Delphinella strobiligena]